MEHTTITTSREQRISVDTYEAIDGTPNNVWLNIAVPMASMSAVLTKAQAKELATLFARVRGGSMSYAQWHQTFVQKVSGYDWHTCRRALFDCHDTLNIWGDKIATDYTTKLWAEIDALRERQAKLTKQGATA